MRQDVGAGGKGGTAALDVLECRFHLCGIARSGDVRKQSNQSHRSGLLHGKDSFCNFQGGGTRQDMPAGFRLGLFCRSFAGQCTVQRRVKAVAEYFRMMIKRPDRT
mmetsp:Transcript_1082/g.2323  ORF Transcript_1082/g.2323 Transcript_1082/m.2323 type:complete len:106 (-) Transcript_1082:689-1006(-)